MAKRSKPNKNKKVKTGVSKVAKKAQAGLGTTDIKDQESATKTLQAAIRDLTASVGSLSKNFQIAGIGSKDIAQQIASSVISAQDLGSEYDAFGAVTSDIQTKLEKANEASKTDFITRTKILGLNQDQSAILDLHLSKGRDIFDINIKDADLQSKINSLGEKERDQVKAAAADRSKFFKEVKTEKEAENLITNSQIERVETAQLKANLEQQKSKRAFVDKIKDEIKSNNLSEQAVDLKFKEHQLNQQIKLISDSNLDSSKLILRELEKEKHEVAETFKIQVEQDEILRKQNHELEKQKIMHDSMSGMTDKFQEALGGAGEEIFHIGHAIKESMVSPMALVGALVGSALEEWGKIGKASRAFLDTTGLTVDQTEHLREEAHHLSLEMRDQGVQMEDVLNAQAALVTQYGGINRVSDEATEKIVGLGKAFGVSADNAAGVVYQMQKSTGASAEIAGNIAALGSNFAKAAGVAPDQVMKDIAGSSEEIAQYFKGTPADLMRTAVEARRLGLSIGKVADISKALLNFESSIEDQMTASVLLGREINLDKARQLAMEGKIQEAAQETLNQMGSLEDFNRMNAVQKDAIAKAAGLTVGELQQSLEKQEAIKHMSADQRKEYEAGLAALKGQNQTTAEKILKDQKNQLTQERIADAVAKISEIFANVILPVLEPIFQVLSDVGSVVADMLKPLTYIGKLFSGWPIKAILYGIIGWKTAMLGLKGITKGLDFFKGLKEDAGKKGISVFRNVFTKAWDSIKGGAKKVGSSMGKDLTDALGKETKEGTDKVAKGGMFSRFKEFAKNKLKGIFGFKDEKVETPKVEDVAADKTKQTTIPGADENVAVMKNQFIDIEKIAMDMFERLRAAFANVFSSDKGKQAIKEIDKEATASFSKKDKTKDMAKQVTEMKKESPGMTSKQALEKIRTTPRTITTPGAPALTIPAMVQSTKVSKIAPTAIKPALTVPPMESKKTPTAIKPALEIPPMVPRPAIPGMQVKKIMSKPALEIPPMVPRPAIPKTVGAPPVKRITTAKLTPPIIDKPIIPSKQPIVPSKYGEPPVPATFKKISIPPPPPPPPVKKIGPPPLPIKKVIPPPPPVKRAVPPPPPSVLVKKIIPPPPPIQKKAVPPPLPVKRVVPPPPPPVTSKISIDKKDIDISVNYAKSKSIEMSKTVKGEQKRIYDKTIPKEQLDIVEKRTVGSQGIFTKIKRVFVKETLNKDIVKNTLDETDKKSKNVFSKLKSNFTSIFKTTNIDKSLNEIDKKSISTFSKVRKGFTGIFDFAGPMLGFNGLKDLGESTFKSLGGTFYDTLSTGLSMFGVDFGSTFSTIVGGAGDLLGGMLGKAGKEKVEAPAPTEAAPKEPAAALTDTVKQEGEKLVTDTLESITSPIQSLTGDIQSKGEELVGGAMEVISDPIGSITDKAQEKGQELLDNTIGSAKEKVTGMLGIGGKEADAPAGVSDKTVKTTTKMAETETKIGSSPGKGIKTFLKNVSKGIASFGNTRVLAGAGNMVLVTPGLLALSVAAIPLLIVAAAGPVISKGLIALSKGISAMGSNGVFKGALGLAAVGVALIPAAIAFSMLKNLDSESIITFSLALAGLAAVATLLGMAAAQLILGAIGIGILGVALIPAAIAFKMIENLDSDAIEAFSVSLIKLSLAAAGIGMLSPLVLAGSYAIGALGIALMPLAAGLNLAAPAIEMVSSSLDSLIQNVTVDALMGISGGLFSIAAGLAALSIAGIGAMPILGALAMAGTAMGAIGSIFGGGEPETKSDTSKKAEKESAEEESPAPDTQLLLDKLDQLIAAITAGGEIKLDAKKVGEVLAVNTVRNYKIST